MRQIFESVIRKKVFYLVHILANGLNEIVLDLNINSETFNSIEIKNGKVLLHTFNDSLEFTVDFDDLDTDDKIEIYHILFCCL